MFVPLWAVASGAVALVAAVLLLVRERRLTRHLLRTPVSTEQRALALPNRGSKFRIVYHTDAGARARDAFARTETAGSDVVEMWHFEALRSTKP